MTLTIGRLGAPEILVAPPAPVGSIAGVRRDVAAFFGIAPRGPCRETASVLADNDRISSWLLGQPARRTLAMPVSSWDEYRLHFGGFEGPGRLPYAVSTFFAGGGQRAYVARVVHEYGNEADNADSVASGVLDGVVHGLVSPRLWARSEGSWGNALSVTLSFSSRPLATREISPTSVIVDRLEWVPVGSLLRLRLPNDVVEFRYVDDSREVLTGPLDRRELTLDAAATALPDRVDVVTGSIEVVDLDPRAPRREVLDGIGFDAAHPRWLARVLINESAYLWPDPGWVDARLRFIEPSLDPRRVESADGHRMAGGEDRWNDVVPEDFWDARWTRGDEVPGDGVHCLAENENVGLLLAPDLYEPAPLEPANPDSEPDTLCGPEFAKHVDPLPVRSITDLSPIGLDGLSLDPLEPAALIRIVANQRELVNYVSQRRDMTVLLDVPLGLSLLQAMEWRNEFDSAYAAAYHPWLDIVTADDERDALVRLNPTAFAAGIIAERERRLGVHYGPANEIAAGAVRVDEIVPADHHDQLHVVGINVFQPERDGIRLSGARTLSRRSDVRQLSVARFMTVLRLSLQREMQWAVFEPNNRALWADVRRRVTGFLMRFYEAGAFRGARPSDAFFVQCDRTTMTNNDVDNGRLVCLVGVNVAEPIEYIVMEIALESDATISASLVGS